jgi:Domain of unknown function (DUF4864)
MQAKLKAAIWASFGGLAFAGVALLAMQMAMLAGTLMASHEAFAYAATKPLLQPVALRAEAPKGFSLTERRKIRNAIRLQIRAYAARDAKRAFARLSPSTQRFFGEPDRFLRSLAQEMPTVLDTRRFAFLGVEQIGQRTVQQVLITDSTEHEWLAEFQLEQMKGGDWRVKGCILQSTPGQQA